MAKRPAKKVTRKKAPARKKKAAPSTTPGADKVARGALGALIAVAVIAVIFALELPSMAARGLGGAMGDAGMNVRTIDVKGVERMESEPVYQIALGQRTRALPLVDVGAVRSDLLAFPYVKDARVSRRYPDTLVIDIVEREPVALWQGRDRLFLIDNEGVILERVPVAELPDLPLLIGEGANQQYEALERLLDRAPTLRPQLASARWVSGRRWDLNVATGEILALPEGEREAAEALDNFIRVDRRSPLLGIGVERYDLRLPGRAIARSEQFEDARERAEREAAEAAAAASEQEVTEDSE
ncbi:cell division protein FtsQ/DivIB [Sphingomicrobium sediminis]|uniref:Cell division protein FtsQ n=1 Tax=Sphingomicrobium sediminis TaxID=2950949 RepID=A0A9X2EGG1_9SPHN|nr:cell division protein FtsQ/DivIB [Sphingomicrobium sediminis]MCM8557563.1 FtsQ-type POTRA domain-containing protein [Sphingomicrobium sediminis]